MDTRELDHLTYWKAYIHWLINRGSDASSEQTLPPGTDGHSESSPPPTTSHGDPLSFNHVKIIDIRFFASYADMPQTELKYEIEQRQLGKKYTTNYHMVDIVSRPYKYILCTY